MERTARALVVGLMQLAFLALIATQLANAAVITRASTVVIGEVDRKGGTVAVLNADGSLDVLQYREESRGLLKDAAKGSAAVATYTEEGGKKVLNGLRTVGKDSVTLISGTVVAMDQTGKTIVVVTANGTKETMQLTDNAVVDTGKGVIRLTDATIKEGTRVSVHCTTSAGRKLAHVVKL